MRQVAAGSLSYALFIATLIYTSIHVNNAVTEPYLDEPFHVGQTQTYCRGQWRQWDPKITTPPGVYVFFVAAHYILGLPCQAAPMRQLNTVLLALLPLVFYDLLRRIRGTGGLGAWTEALGLASFPLVFFFAFLFYTDVASLFVVLLSYDAALAQRYVLSSLMGVLSLGFRQTNVLWIAFVGLDGLLRELEAKGLRNPPWARGFAPLGSPLLAFLSHAATHWRTTTRLLVTYAPVAAAFALFLLWNQGIVLGDKGNHAAALHLPQLLYLLACVLFFGWPVLISVKNLQRATKARFGSVARTTQTVIACLGLSWVVCHYTMEHPFLLADNRHYVFYAWRKIYKRHWIVPYALTPLWVFSATIITDALAGAGRLKLLQHAGLVVVTALTIVPSPLIEPRYFILPYLLLRLFLKPTRTQLLLELAWYAAINTSTIRVFLHRPFLWADDPSLQRFLW